MVLNFENEASVKNKLGELVRFDFEKDKSKRTKI